MDTTVVTHDGQADDIPDAGVGKLRAAAASDSFLTALADTQQSWSRKSGRL
jgi:hypothetical protein